MKFQPRALAGAELSVLLLTVAAAWLATIVLARDMGVMPGTMGLGFFGFVGMWTVMMAAMMLASVAPFASLYSRTMREHRTRRVASLELGYLAVWAATGVAAFVLAAGGDRLATRSPGIAQAVAIGTCVACGAYQLTPTKDRCLQHCRSPLGHLVRYTARSGPLVDFRVGIDHGAWCVGCCWALMLLLVTFGVMNVAAMLVLAAVIIVEKVVAPGRWFSIAVASAAFGLAVAIWIEPSLAPGLHAHSTMPMGGS